MDRTVALVLTVAIGGVLAAQAPLNSALARTVGGVQASFVALGISFAALAACAPSPAGSRAWRGWGRRRCTSRSAAG